MYVIIDSNVLVQFLSLFFITIEEGSKSCLQSYLKYKKTAFKSLVATTVIAITEPFLMQDLVEMNDRIARDCNQGNVN